MWVPYETAVCSLISVVVHRVQECDGAGQRVGELRRLERRGDSTAASPVPFPGTKVSPEPISVDHGLIVVRASQGMAPNLAPVVGD